MVDQSRARVVVLAPDGISPILARTIGQFDMECVRKIPEWLEKGSQPDVKLLVVDPAVKGELLITEALEASNKNPEVKEKPRLVFLSKPIKIDRFKVFDIGCDDVIESSVSDTDLIARLHKSLINHVANVQLQSKLNQANLMAHTALVGSSHLGASVKFLLNASQCGNFDELGLSFFNASEIYGISCSLQIRGHFETKNMEANGLAKDLESQLMNELKDKGRFVDFGSRCIINHFAVSLLIKNMPVDESDCISLKENVHTLIEGVAGRVQALDALRMAELNSELIVKLAESMNGLMTGVEESYRRAMASCVENVNMAAIQVEEAMSNLDLNEQEQGPIKEVMSELVKVTQMLCDENKTTDDNLRKIIVKMDRLSKTESGVENFNLIQELISKF